MHVDIRLPSIVQPWQIWIYLGILLMLLGGTGMCIYGFYERQMIMYKVIEYKKQIEILNEQKIEYERRQTMYEKQMDEQRLEYERQIAGLHEKQKRYDREIAMCEKKMIISNHVDVMKSLRLMKCETWRLADQYVYNIKEYQELKAIEDSWTGSLTTQQTDRMHQLRYNLGLGENYEIPDVNAVTDTVKQISEETLKVLSFQLEVLEDVLDEMNIKKMTKLQEYETIMKFSTFIENQFEEIKLEIINSSREMQARGVLYKISVVFCDHLLPTISKIAVSVATNIISNIIL